MPGRNRRHGRGLHGRVAPEQRPPLLLVGVTERGAPFGHRLRLRVLETCRYPVEHVEVALQRSGWIFPRIIVTLLRACQGPLPDVTEVEDRLTVRHHDVRDHELPIPELAAIPQAFSGAVFPRVEETHEPGGRKD